MTPKNSDSNLGAEQTLDTFVAKLSSSVPANVVILVDGVSYTQPDLVKKANEQLAFFKNARAAKDAWTKATADLRAARGAIRQFLKATKIGMKGYLGVDNPAIEQFGFHFDKKPEMSTDAKVLRAEKARRTREARHTLGP